ncbi:MAG TPA: type II toxin-antitoxin system PemK/MazF family toxin [Candidatus Saccharimonadales bacterium]|jgi:mRNA interferase MazF
MASTKNIKRFEIYWAKLDPTVGNEIQKIRPCVVVSPDAMNKVLGTVIVIPLTSTIIDWPFRFAIGSAHHKSSVACDHVRSVSKERLGRKIGTLTTHEQRIVLEMLRNIFS